jgi:hypothetical protein
MARRLITFLEDRRVLFALPEMENPAHCVESVLKIREYLTTELAAAPESGELAQHLPALRGACRKFLNTVTPLLEHPTWLPSAAHAGHYATWVFYSALGELRAQFGIHIALIAAKFNLDVEDELASIFPEEAERG